MELTEKGKDRKNNYIYSYKMMVKELNLPEKTFKDKLFDFLTLNKEEIDNIELDYEKIPYVFGSHFSNPAYVSNYLTRLFPFTLTAFEIHTFEALERLFINLNKTFDSVTSQKNDLREIILNFLFYLKRSLILINLI